MTQRERVCRRLRELDIGYELTEHPAVFTIEEMEGLGIAEQGAVCKNLFLRDGKGKRHFLVTLPREKKADLKSLAGQLDTGKLGFASPERLERYLGLHRGEVTPLGVLNDAGRDVEVVFDRDLEGATRLGVHPNDNTATVWLSFSGLRAFVEAQGNSIRMVTL